VRRIAGGPLELVQAATEGQPIPGAPGNIGFRVATSALLSDFGPGTYEMLIHLTADGPPVARGTFQLVDAPAAGDEPSRPQP